MPEATRLAIRQLFARTYSKETFGALITRVGVRSGGALPSIPPGTFSKENTMQIIRTNLQICADVASVLTGRDRSTFGLATYGARLWPLRLR